MWWSSLSVFCLILAIVLIAAVGATLWLLLRSRTLRMKYVALGHDYQKLRSEHARVWASFQRVQAEWAEDLRGRRERGQGAPGQTRGLSAAPVVRRQVYNIVTVGITGCGKTALTFKWVNPTAKAESIVATTSDRFWRTISRQLIPEEGALVDHVFEFRDWGGEHRGGAQNMLLTDDEIRAVIMVVDLGAFDPVSKRQVPSRERVQSQIEAFNPHVLPMFFSRGVTAHCQTFVLFINKADLLSGTWEQVERQALELYRPLIDALYKYQGRDGMAIEVVVGSAHGGHNTHELGGLLIRRLLPAEAYDDPLRARLRGAPEQPDSAQTLLVEPVGDTQPGAAPL